ncbi:MAG TPA: DUF134 domain-containing protein [Thermoguttaceae bacterium]|nr:DUF134 domain-containing protein [Thermoguttaceae bacterium]
MVRPKRCRRVGGEPPCRLFKPAGVPASSLAEVVLADDELEAIRLADFKGLYHEEAARRMNVSRPTFGRIIASARKKVAQALVKSQTLRIEGGPIQMAEMRKFKCCDCQHVWGVPYGESRPDECPSCQSGNFHRDECDGGKAGGTSARGRGQCRGGAGRGRCQRSSAQS